VTKRRFGIFTVASMGCALAVASFASGSVTPIGGGVYSTPPDCNGKPTYGTALQGDDENDTIAGTAKVDVLRGGGGNDKINGKAADDCLAGQGADDTLKGGRGDDLLNGGAADDRLEGGSGSDSLRCGGGRDVAIAANTDKVSGSCEVVH
jgi:Ca2+-binding RTX toxin-like protein